MEHPFFINNPPRTEALSWLSISEKLLTNRDLVGSKSFATRAKESDPTLLPADQILAIVDTLIAGDKRINNQHLDYYSILQIPQTQTHDSELIANQYRRLALLLNPQKNSFPYAEHAFHLVVDAWSVLSNAFRRSVYDKEIGFFVNLNPTVTAVGSPPANPIGFMQPTTAMFQNHPVPSSSRERQTVAFFQEQQPQQQLQTVTFLSRMQTEPQPAIMLSPEREQPQQPFTFGSTLTRTQQQQLQQQQQQQQQLQQQQLQQQRNEGMVGQNSATISTNLNSEALFVNAQTRPATTASNNVNYQMFFGNTQNLSVSTSNNQDLFGSAENQSASTSNNQGLFGHTLNQSASTSNNQGLFGHTLNHSASTSNHQGLFLNTQNQSARNNEGLFGGIQNQSVTNSNHQVLFGNAQNQSAVGNIQNQSASTSNHQVLFGNAQNQSAASSHNQGLFGNAQNQPAITRNNVNNEGLVWNNQNQPATARSNVNNEGLFVNNQNRPEGLFGNNQNHSATIRSNEGLFGNSQNQSATTSNNVNNEGLFGNSQSEPASSMNNAKGKPGGVDKSIPSFWTACPYCYIMYEYALDYVDCTLRCHNCKRAFQAVKLPSAPPIIEGKEAYICCWGFMPLGFSMDTFKKYKSNISTWTPFVPVKTKQGGLRRPSAPRVYIDDDPDADVFLGLSESSGESDEDWRNYYQLKKKKKTKTKKAKGKRGRRKKNNIQQSDFRKDVVRNSDGNVQVSATQGVGEMPNVMTAESSKGSVASNTRRQSGRVAKDYGKLDLNVEFSNEVEEPPAPGVDQGNGAARGEVDNNIEGIEFFEGLDEFLSSLPILNTAGDDKVKAA